jgi:HTH-type transcriptional regulator/antitoxin HigA
MKTTLIAIENDADHVQANALVEKLMGSRRSDDRVRLVAQARLIEAYERSRWTRSVPTLPVLLNYLMDQHDLSRSDLVRSRIHHLNPHPRERHFLPRSGAGVSVPENR